MKCVVFAYSQLGHDCLQYIIEKTPHEVCLVVTHDDNAQETIWFDSVEKLAIKHKIPVIKPLSLNKDDIQKQILDCKPDVLFSFYYRMMIPASIFEAPSLGAYNMHGSLLPKYRGRCPVNWAILNGETETGVTLHEMVAKADQGAILAQKKVAIEKNDNAGLVTKKLNRVAVEILSEQIDLIALNKVKKTPQDHTQSSYFGGRKSEDGCIDWSWPAQRIIDLIRALQPSPQYPPAYAWIYDKQIFFKKAEIVHLKPQELFAKGKDQHGEYWITSCGLDSKETIKLYIQN